MVVAVLYPSYAVIACAREEANNFKYACPEGEGIFLHSEFVSPLCNDHSWAANDDAGGNAAPQRILMARAASSSVRSVPVSSGSARARSTR